MDDFLLTLGALTLGGSAAILLAVPSIPLYPLPLWGPVAVLGLAAPLSAAGGSLPPAAPRAA